MPLLLSLIGSPGGPASLERAGIRFIDNDASGGYRCPIRFRAAEEPRKTTSLELAKRNHQRLPKMWAVLGFLLAAGIGLMIVLAAGRRGSAQRGSYPWMLAETANLHVGIMGSLAGFAFTGIVLVVTLARDRPGVAESSLDTVVVMFLVAYLFWVGNAFLISYMPHVDTSGDLVPRIHFSLASTIEYRTVFVSWFALLPLLEANGLGRLAYVLYFLLPASLLLGSLIIRWPGSLAGQGNVPLGSRGHRSRTDVYRHRRIRGPRRSVPVFRAEPHARYLLREHHWLHARSAHAALTAICRN
jgi:hypothetical protein